MPDPGEVRGLFGRIARRYDLLNHVLSMGIDRRWRRRAVRVAGARRGSLVVDVCCGTGDLSVEFARAGASVLGVDFTPEMLRFCEPKLRALGLNAECAQGDALRLPVRSGAADVASVAFGVRNLASTEAGLGELARVVRPGGVVVVLEFSPPPRGFFGGLYRWYFMRVLPRIGGWISGDAEAYRYLPRTVSAWLSPVELQQRMEQAGLVECAHEALTFGIASLHWGRVASRSERSLSGDAAALEGAAR